MTHTMTAFRLKISLKAAGLDDELIEMLLDELTTCEQQSFLESIAHALQISGDLIVIKFDSVWELVGFDKKEDAEHLLKNDPLMIEDVDYYIEDVEYYIENIINKKETIVMNLNALRTLCMVSGTEKGRRVYQYFRMIESILYSYMEMENKRRDTELAEIKTEKLRADTDTARLHAFTEMFKTVSTMTDPETQKTMVDVIHRLLPKNT